MPRNPRARARARACVRARTSPLALAFALALSSAGPLGCLCPPCPAGAGLGGASVASPVAPAATVASSNAPTPDRLVIWDGDKASPGQSWADCAKKDMNCKSALTKAPGAGTNGTVGMKWHGEGPDWLGSGWNWFGWWPKDAGTDVSAYAKLTFQFKLQPKSADLAPDGEALAFGLTCSHGEKCKTSLVPVHRYVADFADGQWHKVTIPMEDLVAGDGAGFDKKSAWEFDFTNWSGTARDFDVYVDDIAFEK